MEGLASGEVAAASELCVQLFRSGSSSVGDPRGRWTAVSRSGVSRGLTFHVEVIHREKVFAELDVRLHLQDGEAKSGSEERQRVVICPSNLFSQRGEFVKTSNPRVRTGRGAGR